MKFSSRFPILQVGVIAGVAYASAVVYVVAAIWLLRRVGRG